MRRPGRRPASPRSRRDHGRPGALLVRGLAFGALFGAVAAGCATIGHTFPAENVASVRQGETTKAQLLGYFGLPYRRGLEDGDSTWTWVHYKYSLFGERSRTRDLFVRFDETGRVKSYTYSSNMD